MSDYRWNISDFAVTYDQAAEKVHPYYLELQDAVLREFSFADGAGVLILDAGGGSGRLMERALNQWPQATGIVLDQSEPFLALAERRLSRFGKRAKCIQARLQDDWPALLPAPLTAIVSMSAIHHLDPAEKQAFYRRCYDALVPGGILLNGDEVRPASKDEYRALLEEWSAHMQRGMAGGSIPPGIHTALRGWIERNVTHFGQPKQSGDDCHETADAQIGYLHAAGFTAAGIPWREKIWALLSARK